MTAVTATAMVAAIVIFPMVMMFTMMIALYIGIIDQIAIYQCFHCSIRIAGYAAIELNTSCCQSHLRTTANTAADQYICTEGCQYACQSTVTAAVGIHNF